MLESRPQTTMDDDRRHGGQLQGKQLVFVVMAATVVAVAVFLCGVMVGRGVLTAAGDRATRPADATAEVLPSPEAPLDGADTPDTLEPRYAEFLDPPDTVPEEVLAEPVDASPPEPTLKPALEPARESALKPAPKPRPETLPGGEAAPRSLATARAAIEPPRTDSAPPARRPLPAASGKVPVPVPAVGPTSAPTSAAGGFVVQVAALKGRPEAEAIRRRLEGRGYPAFVEVVGSGARAVFRVRVGHYQSRQTAASVAARLEREERYKPWITR